MKNCLQTFHTYYGFQPYWSEIWCGLVTVFTKYSVAFITDVPETPYDRILLLGTKNIQFSTLSILAKATLY